MLGYKKETRNTLVQADKSVFLTPVLMEVEAKNLGAIVITAQKPPVEIMADKTVINLESFVLNSGGNAFTVMQNLPGVVISNNGAVSLNGKSGAKVLIDGKISYLEGTELVNYLKSTPVSSLEKVELVANPSAKYDASGNSGVINIRTRRAKLMGFNLTLNSSYEQGKYGRANNNISFNHRNGKFNVFGMAAFQIEIIIRTVKIGWHHCNVVCSILQIKALTHFQSGNFRQCIRFVCIFQLRSKQAIFLHWLRSITRINASATQEQ